MIGSHVAKELLQRGINVTAIVRPMSEKLRNLEWAEEQAGAAALLGPDRTAEVGKMRVVECNLYELPSLRDKLGWEHDAFFHFGWDYTFGTGRNEARKVHDYCIDKGVVGPEDVALLCSNAVEDKIFDMCRAISQKNAAVAISQYQDLIKLKKSVVTIMGRIQAQYNQLLDVKILLEEGKKPADIESKLRLSKWITSRLISLANSYTRKQLIEAVDMCQEAIMMNNSGGLLGNAAVENLIVKLLTKGA